MNATETKKELRDRILNQLKTVLDESQGRRSARTLTYSDIELTLKETAKRPDGGWFSKHGGSVANSYGYATVTTFLLGYRKGGEIYLGIGESPCPSPSPGRVWPILQPWKVGKPETVQRKLDAWVDSEQGPINCGIADLWIDED